MTLTYKSTSQGTQQLRKKVLIVQVDTVGMTAVGREFGNSNGQYTINLGKFMGFWGYVPQALEEWIIVQVQTDWVLERRTALQNPALAKLQNPGDGAISTGGGKITFINTDLVLDNDSELHANSVITDSLVSETVTVNDELTVSGDMTLGGEISGGSIDTNSITATNVDVTTGLKVDNISVHNPGSGIITLHDNVQMDSGKVLDVAGSLKSDSISSHTIALPTTVNNSLTVVGPRLMVSNGTHMSNSYLGSGGAATISDTTDSIITLTTTGTTLGKAYTCRVFGVITYDRVVFLKAFINLAAGTTAGNAVFASAVPSSLAPWDISSGVNSTVTGSYQGNAVGVATMGASAGQIALFTLPAIAAASTFIVNFTYLIQKPTP